MDRFDRAELAVIGSMLRDPRRVPLALSKLTPEDFNDSTCRNFFQAIRELALAGSPIDPVTVMDKLNAGNAYVRWADETLDVTPTAANIEAYIPMVRERAIMSRFHALCEQGISCIDMEAAQELARKMLSNFSATDRMPMMTGPERVADFWERMKNPEKPKYLPWGIPTADRNVYAELGDMILLGGNASAGKTLLSITMAQAQAKGGYKVGYYSLETSPQKMTDRQLSSLADVPLEKIKMKKISEGEWGRFAEAGNFAATEGSFAVMDASGSTVEDITAHALGHGFQVIYVDYVQNLLVPGIRKTESYARVTEISQTLKTFSRSTKTAVVALAQLSRPPKENGKPVPPSMHSFKESGQLEQDADAAFLIYPSNPNDNTSSRIFKIGKNKEGPRAQVELVFHGDTQTMVELEPAPDRSVAAELSAKGRAIQQKNRANGQARFQELKGGNKDNPFA